MGGREEGGRDFCAGFAWRWGCLIVGAVAIGDASKLPARGFWCGKLSKNADETPSPGGGAMQASTTTLSARERETQREKGGWEI